MDYIHQRYLRHFSEQDVIGHMDKTALARAAGYTDEELAALPDQRPITNDTTTLARAA